MKKFLKAAMLVGAVVFFLSLSGVKGIHAELMYLSEDQTVFYDLDADGTKEAVKVESLPKSNEDYQPKEKFVLYINNKKVYEQKLEYSYGVDLAFIDINPGNKYKQIIVRSFFEDAEGEYYVFNYKNGKCSFWFYTYYDLIEQQDKNNRVKCISAVECRLGSPHVVYDCKIKNSELVPVQNKINKVADNWAGTEHWYEAAVKIKVYAGKTSVNKKKVVRTLKKGEQFRITKLMGTYKKGYFTPTYALIDTADGESIGWINIKGTYWGNKQIVTAGLIYG